MNDGYTDAVKEALTLVKNEAVLINTFQFEHPSFRLDYKAFDIVVVLPGLSASEEDRRTRSDFYFLLNRLADALEQYQYSRVCVIGYNCFDQPSPMAPAYLTSGLVSYGQVEELRSLATEILNADKLNIAGNASEIELSALREAAQVFISSAAPFYPTATAKIVLRHYGSKRVSGFQTGPQESNTVERVIAAFLTTGTKFSYSCHVDDRASLAALTSEVPSKWFDPYFTDFPAGGGEWVPEPNAEKVTFTEVPINTQNPTFALGDLTMTTSGSFMGQTVIDAFGGRTITGVPSDPLTLNPIPYVYTTSDGSAPSPDERVLSGVPQYQGVLSFMFSEDIQAFAVSIGYINSEESVLLEVYNRRGEVVFSKLTADIGYFVHGVFSYGHDIAGASVYLKKADPYGFGIDEVYLLTKAAPPIEPPEIPEDYYTRFYEDWMEINHEPGLEPVFLVQQREDMTLGLEDGTMQLFEACAVRFTPPGAGGNGLSEMTFTFDNTDRRLSDYISRVKRSPQPLQCIYRAYLSNDLEQPQGKALRLVVSDVKMRMTEVVLRASFGDLLNKPFLNENYTRRRFPSIGG